MTELPQDIKDIDKRINSLQQKKEKTKSPNNILLQQAFRFATEFVSPVIISLILGYFADNWFKTRPIIMLILVIFGCAAGVLNVYKIAKETDEDIK